MLLSCTRSSHLQRRLLLLMMLRPARPLAQTREQELAHAIHAPAVNAPVHFFSANRSCHAKILPIFLTTMAEASAPVAAAAGDAGGAEPAHKRAKLIEPIADHDIGMSLVDERMALRHEAHALMDMTATPSASSSSSIKPSRTPRFSWQGKRTIRAMQSDPVSNLLVRHNTGNRSPILCLVSCASYSSASSVPT